MTGTRDMTAQVRRRIVNPSNYPYNSSRYKVRCSRSSSPPLPFLFHLLRDAGRCGTIAPEFRSQCETALQISLSSALGGRQPKLRTEGCQLLRMIYFQLIKPSDKMLSQTT